MTVERPCARLESGLAAQKIKGLEGLLQRLLARDAWFSHRVSETLFFQKAPEILR
jgi:hypothetical protein